MFWVIRYGIWGLGHVKKTMH